MRTTDRAFIAAAVLACFSAAPVASAFAREDAHELPWGLVEDLAGNVAQGSDALIENWPGEEIALMERNNRLRIDGGAFDLGASSRVTKSEIRLNTLGEVRVVVLDVEGGCVTREEVKRKYPAANRFAIPQPNNPKPFSYEEVTLNDVLVSFGFYHHEPACMFQIVMKTPSGPSSGRP